jgi:hypothetical protein
MDAMAGLLVGLTAWGGDHLGSGTIYAVSFSFPGFPHRVEARRGHIQTTQRVIISLIVRKPRHGKLQRAGSPDCHWAYGMLSRTKSG